MRSRSEGALARQTLSDACAAFPRRRTAPRKRVGGKIYRERKGQGTRAGGTVIVVTDVCRDETRRLLTASRQQSFDGEDAEAAADAAKQQQKLDRAAFTRTMAEDDGAAPLGAHAAAPPYRVSILGGCAR